MATAVMPPTISASFNSFFTTKPFVRGDFECVASGTDHLAEGYVLGSKISGVDENLELPSAEAPNRNVGDAFYSQQTWNDHPAGQDGGLDWREFS